MSKVTDLRTHPVRESGRPTADRLIRREALLERLHYSRLGRASLIQAPAGYGKTTLLKAWQHALSAQHTEVVWLSLDEEHRHPERFFMVLRRAIQRKIVKAARIGRDMDRRALPALQQARQLAASLGARSEPLVIILDDYHRAAGEELDAPLAEFLGGLPTGVHVAISSRPPVSIPTGAMSLSAALTRFELKDMRFSDAEINELFNHELKPEELASISVWTEGWPIVVQLARSYLQDQVDRSGALQRLSVEADQDVGRYLTEQVLRRLPAPEKDVLVTTSFLERLDPDVVEAVTGTRDAWRVLERLAAASVLVSDPEPGESTASYRCHHLLRETLYAELRYRGRADVVRLRTQAARWFRQRGRLDEALRHGRAAGDFDLVAEIILEKGGILVGVRQGSPDLRRLLEYLPPEQLSRHPRLRLAQCFELAKEGRMDAARDAIRAVRSRHQTAINSDPLLTRDLALAEICVAAYSGTATLTASQIQVLEEAIRDAREDDVLGRAILNNLLAAMYYQRSDFERASAAGEAALHGYGQVAAVNGLAHTHLHLGLIQLELASTEVALEHFQQAKVHFQSTEVGDEGGGALADVLIAEALYEKGELEQAWSLCSSAVRAMEDGEHFYPAFASAFRTLSGLAFLRDGLSAALGLLDNAIRAARRRRLSEFERVLHLRRAELQLQAGQFSRLNDEPLEKLPGIWDRCETENDRTWYETDRQALLNVRLTLQDGELEQAIALLRDLDQRCSTEGRIRSRIPIMILLACAYYKAGKRDAAITAMRQAIATGSAGPALRAFFEDGPAAMPILVHLSASAESRGLTESETHLVSQLLRALQVRSPVAAALFSTRELEILQQLVLGNNNKLIARALGITPDTVRFHLKKIYEKLGVSDRKVVATVILQRGLLSAPKDLS